MLVCFIPVLLFYCCNRERTKIIIDDTIFFKTAISILMISNRDSVRVLYDKIVSVHFISKIYMVSPGTVPVVSAHFRYLLFIY